MRRRPWRSCQIGSRRIVAPRLSCPSGSQQPIRPDPHALETPYPHSTEIAGRAKRGGPGRAGRIRLTGARSSCIHLSSCILRPTTAGPRKPPPCPRVDRCPASPNPTVVPPAPPTRSGRRPWRACGPRSTGSTRNWSPCSIGGRRSRSRSARSSRSRGWRSGRRRARTRSSRGRWPPAAARCPRETLRLIFRELMSGSRSLQRTFRVAYLGPKYSYSHLAVGRQVRRGGRARPGRLDRRGLRGGQPPARPVRDRAAGELDRRADRRHARHVRPAAGPEDPRRGPAPGPPLPARPLRVGPGPADLLQGAGAVAVPPLARQEPAAGPDRRRRLDRRGGRARPARGVRRRDRQPRRGRRLSAQHPGREHRGPAAQRHPVRRHRRARRGADRPRQDDPDAPPAEPVRRAGQGDRPVREERRQHDLDRVVPHLRGVPPTATRPTSSSSTSRATSTTNRCGRPWRPSASGASGSKSSAPIPAASASRAERLSGKESF